MAEPSDVLASLAAALGVPWDGPGSPTVAVDLPDGVPGWLVLDRARESLLTPGRRRRLGAHHTPPDLARRLVALALDGLGPDAVVLDPACGGGAFLVAAAEHGVRHLVGRDVDPLAVATTKAALRCWGTDGDVALADAVADGWPTVDVVVGNPPFLSPLGTVTNGGPAAESMRRRLGAPYADVAGLVLLRAIESVRPGGRVVLLQPESLLSARDAAPIRAAAAPHLEGMWVADEPVFGASVRVCAPVLRIETPAPTVARWHGIDVRPAGRASRPSATWNGLRPETTPPVRVGSRTVADIATATAGFRDEFYGLAAVVQEDGPGHPLVTSGLIDPGRLAWGVRPARIAKRRYQRPTVDPSAIDDDRLRAWVVARLVPKVLVATQTKVVEAAPDPMGTAIPLTPVLAVVPHDPQDVWRLAAALTSPVVSAWARREFAGAALSAEALKLSATQLLQAPLPEDDEAWATATAALEAARVFDCGSTLAGGDQALLTWWQGRLPGSDGVRG